MTDIYYNLRQIKFVTGTYSDIIALVDSFEAPDSHEGIGHNHPRYREVGQLLIKQFAEDVGKLEDLLARVDYCLVILSNGIAITVVLHETWDVEDDEEDDGLGDGLWPLSSSDEELDLTEDDAESIASTDSERYGPDHLAEGVELPLLAGGEDTANFTDHYSGEESFFSLPGFLPAGYNVKRRPDQPQDDLLFDGSPQKTYEDPVLPKREPRHVPDLFQESNAFLDDLKLSMACATNDGSQEDKQVSVVDYATAQSAKLQDATTTQSDTPPSVSSIITDGDSQDDAQALVVCSAAHQPAEPLGATASKPDSPPTGSSTAAQQHDACRETSPLGLLVLRSNKRKVDDDADDETAKRPRHTQGSE
jgi:hypothetical protein